MAVKTASVTGLWSNTATWGGAAVPGDGDNVIINTGITVTLDDARTVGLSGASDTTAAISLGTTGQLIIAGTGNLTCRGDITFTGGTSNGTDAVVMQAGAILTFDASAAVSPSTTRYRFGGTSSVQYRALNCQGTSGSHCIVTSNLASSALAGVFRIDTITTSGLNTGMSIIATYTDFSNIGDSVLEFSAPTLAFTSSSNQAVHNITYCTFTNCGAINITANSASITCIHSYSKHTGTLAAYPLRIRTDTVVSGTRTVTWNSFDKCYDAGSNVTAAGITFEDNYFGNAFRSATSLAAKSSSFARNFINLTTSSTPWVLPSGDVDKCVFFTCLVIDNPHIIQWVPIRTSDITNSIFEQTENFTSDAGEVMTGPTGNPTGASTYNFKNNLILPTKTGTGAFQMLSSTGASLTNVTHVLDNNTCVGTIGFGLMGVDETSDEHAGQLGSFRNNLGYSYTQTNWFKILEIGHISTGTPVQDVVSPTQADYNCCFHFKDKYVLNNFLAFLNQGNGYAASFSATPGSHDLSIDPVFRDKTRSVMTFDSDFLGNNPADWVVTTAYSVGDFVKSTDGSAYGGKKINFRCIANHTSSATDQPLVGTNWRNDWEPASIFRVRDAIESGTTYTNTNLGIVNGSLIQILHAWIFQGYQPTNLALKSAGFDGSDVGAAPVYTTGVSNMAIAFNSVVKPITIAGGQSYSTVIQLDSALVAIEMPSGWDAADINLLTSSDGVTYNYVYDDAANLLVIKVSASKFITLNNIEISASNYLKLQSASATVAVNQTTDRILNCHFRKISTR